MEKLRYDTPIFPEHYIRKAYVQGVIQRRIEFEQYGRQCSVGV
jgi:hypothetical protein